VRIALDVPRAEPDRPHQLTHALLLLGAAMQPEGLHRLGDDLTDRHARIERRVRILKDHLQMAPLFPELPRRQVRQVHAAEDD
jgi:hypothetical protein